jgi:hypothetical protein
MSVTVRRKRSWRYGLRFLTLLEILITAPFCWVAARDLSPALGLLLFAIVTVPTGLMLLHFERWSVTFSQKGIEWKRYFHPWSHVERVWESHSATELRVISIRFRDGQVLRFRMEEDNAEQARKWIIRHCSIES